MVRMGTVWDRTTDVLQGRSGILATLAIGFVLLPQAVSGTLEALVTPTEPNATLALAGGIASIVAGLLMIAGIIAMTAVASDPDVDAAAGSRIAFARLGPALGLVAAIMVVLVVALIPIGLALAAVGARVSPLTRRIDVSHMSAGGMAGAGLLALVLVAVCLWLSAKMVPLFGIAVNERRGLGAFARSLALTRGATLRLIGVQILYAIVTVIVAGAATSVAGVVFALLLGEVGEDGPTTTGIVVAVVGATITALATVVQTVFYARYYVAAVAATGGSTSAS